MSGDAKPAPGDGGAGAEGLVPEADEIIGTGEAATQSAPDTEEMDALRREGEENRQAMLRALAEAENVRRRAQREVADAKAYAIASFARDLLNVSDNFKRALSAVSDPNAADMAPEMRALLEGVQMTERELDRVFAKHGVTVLEPVGEKFDPNRHQAMFEIENAEVPTGTVLQVMQAGAVIGERVLRPAMVGVSKGGPKPGAKPAEGEAEAASDEAASREGAPG